jgi:hypothetical protein
MSSVFEGTNIDHAIEKIHDHLNRSGSGYDAQMAGPMVRSIADVLWKLESKMREHHIAPNESDFPTANYAIQELQKYVDNQQGKIADATEARIYTRALKSDLDALRQLERDIDQAAS